MDLSSVTIPLRTKRKGALLRGPLKGARVYDRSRYFFTVTSTPSS